MWELKNAHKQTRPNHNAVILCMLSKELRESREISSVRSREYEKIIWVHVAFSGSAQQ